eukprot:PhM_4_TR7063/c0_g1_i1/m.35637
MSTAVPISDQQQTTSSSAYDETDKEKHQTHPALVETEEEMHAKAAAQAQQHHRGSIEAPHFMKHKPLHETDGDMKKEEDDGDEEEVPNTEYETLHKKSFAVLGGAMMVLLGFGEGIAMHASGVTSPLSIRGQMVFRVWVVLKMFLSAVASSMVFQSIYSLHHPKTFDKTRFYRNSTAGLLRVCLGCAVLGVGMCLAGSGPTMAPPQLGAGVKYAWATILGMCLGGAAYSILEQHSMRCERRWHFFSPICELQPRKGKDGGPPLPLAVDDYLKVPYALLAFPCGVFLLGVCVIIEYYVGTHDDDGDILAKEMGRRPPLHPTVAGIIIGVNQLPIRLLTGDGQGGSSAVMLMLAVVTRKLVAARHSPLTAADTYQFWFVYVGSTLGAFAALFLIPGFTTDSMMPGYDWPYCIIGGFLMLFGARIANGCTCGNGISGVSELSWHSMIGAGCIFGAAIATGFILDASGAEMKL